MYYLVYGFLYLLSLLPMWMLFGLSDGLAFLLYTGIRYRRAVVTANLRHAFPEKTEAERRRIARRFYRNFTDNFIETIKLLSASPEWLEKHFVLDNPELLDYFYDQGRKLQLHMGHCFNWEIANLVMPKRTRYTFLVTYMPLTNKNFERMFLRLRARTGTVLLPATRMSRAIIPYRNQQYMLVLVADQAPGGPDQPGPQPVGDRHRAHHKTGADQGEHQPGGVHAPGDLRVRHEDLDDRDGPRTDRRGLQQGVPAGHRDGGGPAQAGGGGQGGGRGPGPADLHPAGGVGGRDVDRDPAVGAGLGGGDGTLQLAAVGGDRQRRADGGGLPFGVGQRPVAGHLPHHQAERHGERQHDHRGHRENDPDQRPPHGCGCPPGASSLTPTPRSVCR